MLGASEKGRLDHLTPQRRYLERSRKYRADQAALARRRAAIAAAEAEAPTLPDPHTKGHCRHCGEHVGRGVAFHERKCPASQTS